MRKDPYEVIKLVNDRASFVEFVRMLGIGFKAEVEIERKAPSSPYGSGALGWENGTIATFLDAASAWGKDTAQSGEMQLDENPWRTCAEIIFAGKFYE